MASKLELHKVGMYWFMISAICTLSFCINIIAGIVSSFVVLVLALRYFIKNYEDEFTCFAYKQFLTQAVSPLNNQGLKPAVRGSDVDASKSNENSGLFDLGSVSSASSTSFGPAQTVSPLNNQGLKPAVRGSYVDTLTFGENSGLFVLRSVDPVYLDGLNLSHPPHSICIVPAVEVMTDSSRIASDASIGGVDGVLNCSSESDTKAGSSRHTSDYSASQELIEEKSPIGNQQRRSSLGGANGATLSFGVPMYSGASHCSTQSESSDDYSEVSSLDGDSAFLQKRMADLQNQSCYSGDDTSDWDKLDYSIKTVSEGTESEISSLASEEAHSSKEFKDCDASIDDRSINIKFLGDFFKRAFGNTASAPAPEAMVDDASSELPVASKKAFSGVFNCGRLGQLRAREGDSDFPGNSFSS